MSDIVTSLKAELAALEEDLAKHPDPRVIKIQKIKDLLQVYGLTVGGSAVGGSPPSSLVRLYHLTDSIFTAPPSARPASKRDRFRGETTALLKERGLVHRNVILEYLTAKGIMGNEKDPMASLASYLSEAKDIFAYDGKGGWYLRSMADEIDAPEEKEFPLPTSSE